jgi:NitT/TauT family transport system permease protein
VADPGRHPPTLYWLLALVGLVAPLLAWWFAASSDGGDKVFLPGPPTCWGRMELGSEDELLGDVAISTWRVVAGWPCRP